MHDDDWCDSQNPEVEDIIEAYSRQFFAESTNITIPRTYPLGTPPKEEASPVLGPYSFNFRTTGKSPKDLLQNINTGAIPPITESWKSSQLSKQTLPKNLYVAIPILNRGYAMYLTRRKRHRYYRLQRHQMAVPG